MRPTKAQGMSSGKLHLDFGHPAYPGSKPALSEIYDIAQSRRSVRVLLLDLPSRTIPITAVKALTQSTSLSTMICAMADSHAVEEYDQWLI